MLSAGGQQPRIRFIPVQLAGDANEDRSRELREQEEAARRAAEDNHRRAQLRTALSSLPPPLVTWLVSPVVTCCGLVVCSRWSIGRRKAVCRYHGNQW